MARKKYDYQEIPFGFVMVIAMAIVIPVITLLLMFKDHATHDTPARIIILNTSSSQPLPQLQKLSDSNSNINPSPKDLTLPSGFHQLKWGDGMEKLNHPVLVTDNEDNIQVAGYEVDANMHEVPQCYTQKGENLKLGMNHIDEIAYCFTNKQLSQVQVYRNIAYLPGYNENNCNSYDCIASKDQTWNSVINENALEALEKDASIKMAIGHVGILNNQDRMGFTLSLKTDEIQAMGK